MTQKSGKRPAAGAKTSEEFTAEKRAAMRARAKELKGKGDGESALLAQLATLKGPERVMGERLHALIKANAPTLSPKTWYGMPAYANKDCKIVCFFRSRDKFKERYATLGFNPEANLDEGTLWPIAFALTELTPATEAKVVALVRKAVS